MNTTLLGASEWAQVEFGNSSLGDLRRAKRLVQVASALAEKPSGALPSALSNWAELKAAYRLLARPEVTYERIIPECFRDCLRTRQDCQQRGKYFLIEDTTQLDFTNHRETKGLGRIGDDGGQGLCLHTTLAVRVENWLEDMSPEVTLAGLFNQKCWVREAGPKKGQESKSQRLKRKRESQRWAEWFPEIGMPPEGVEWTHIGDRESDIYEAFERCKKSGREHIIRACQARSLEGEDVKVFEAVGQSPLLGILKVKLRARPGSPAREAQVEVRALGVTLRGPWRPDRRPAPLSMNVVEAKEINVPAGVEPIHWVLLTSWPIETFQQVIKVIKAYGFRWLSEEYHKALKTGAGIEMSQLSEGRRIKALLGILAIVAIRLLNMKLLARAKPNMTIAPEEIGVEALRILEKKFGLPKGGWNYKNALTAIARLGGFLARKGDGHPGWITIWRGWQRLMDMVQGYTMAKAMVT